MAIENVAQNQQSSFADPQNGTSPIDADEVTANDNALRGKFNTHDADTTIHVQGSALASRPAFGTLGRKWMTRDSGVVRLFYDTGSAWVELSYVPTSSDATITGILTFSTAPVFSSAQAFASSVSIGTSLAVTTSATVGTSLTVGTTLGVTGATTLAAVSGTTATFSSTFNATGNSTFGGTLGITGACTAASFSGAGTGLTAIPAAQLTGTAAAINGSNITDLNGTAVASGTVAAARLPTALGTRTFTSVETDVFEITANGALEFSATNPVETVAIYFNQYQAVAGSNTPDPFDNTCPVATQTDWKWIKVNVEGGLGWIPVCME